MKMTTGSQEHAEQDALDTLLSHAPRYAPSAGFAERVLAALHEEEEKAATPRPFRAWYLRPYTWGASAAAACLLATFCVLSLTGTPTALPAESLAVDDALLVDEALDAIDDPDLVSAICSVSLGTYSISTGGDRLP